MELNFSSKRENITNENKTFSWIENSGLGIEELQALVLETEEGSPSRMTAKAKTFSLLIEKCRIAIDKENLFQTKLFTGDIMLLQRARWEDAVKKEYLAKESRKIEEAWQECHAYTACSDFGHVSPNSQLLLSVGLCGLLQRVERAAEKPELSERQKEYYDSCRTVLLAMMRAAERLGEAILPYNEDNGRALLNIAKSKPQNTYEAMQLLILYFYLHEYVAGTRVRSLGRVDVLFYPFFKKDIESGAYTKEQIRELFKFFLYKFFLLDVPYGLPFCISGLDKDGNEVTSELTYIIVEAYNELNIHSPKIHVRVSDKTPKDFIKLVLSCIRGGNSGFVFTSDNTCTKALMNVGIEKADALNYVPIGCYEPAVWGVEIGCTGNGGVNGVKAVELAMNGGRDILSGKAVGLPTGRLDSFSDFLSEVKRQLGYMVEQATDYICKIESYYSLINPDSILSCQYDRSVDIGLDVYEGGAKYNNSSYYLYFIASLIDSICAVKKLVYDDKLVSLSELCDVLKNNWQGAEKLRAVALCKAEKYGRGDKLADAVTAEITDFFADVLNNKPNGRGGVFKAAMFSIDLCFSVGKQVMATPDGRLAGDPLSKNLCATLGMDNKGVTTLINSVTKIDHSKYPTGSVLDIVLHPSAVAGEDGLDAFLGLLLTYIKKGGFALHGNVFDAEELKRARREPEKYKGLQVRVCGWNSYFVNLTTDEQNSFIKQAEGNV